MGILRMQPPSGGCVLKPLRKITRKNGDNAATFGWLCVETQIKSLRHTYASEQPPSGGCVLKHCCT